MKQHQKLLSVVHICYKTGSLHKNEQGMQQQLMPLLHQVNLDVIMMHLSLPLIIKLALVCIFVMLKVVLFLRTPLGSPLYVQWKQVKHWGCLILDSGQLIWALTIWIFHWIQRLWSMLLIITIVITMSSTSLFNNVYNCQVCHLTTLWLSLTEGKQLRSLMSQDRQPIKN